MCAAALATLTVLREERLMENAATTGGYFKERLEALAADTGRIAEVRGMGLMLAVELKEEGAKDITLSCLERGYVINGIGSSILRFLPPLSISKLEVDGLVALLGELLSRETGGGR